MTPQAITPLSLTAGAIAEIAAVTADMGGAALRLRTPGAGESPATAAALEMYAERLRTALTKTTPTTP